MSGAQRAFGDLILDLARRFPFVIGMLLAAGGTAWAASALADAKKTEALRKGEKSDVVVEQIIHERSYGIKSDYFFSTTVDGESIKVPVFKGEAERLEPGQTVAIYRAGDSSGLVESIDRRTIVNLGGTPFDPMGFVGVAMVIVGFILMVAPHTILRLEPKRKPYPRG